MGGFLTGIVEIVDKDGNRVDTPDANGDYAPVQLQLGEGLTGTPSSSGSLRRVTVDAEGSAVDTNAPKIGLSLVDCLIRNTNANQVVFAGAVGTMFAIMPGPAGTNPAIIAGIKLYWDPAEASQVKLSLWHKDESERLAFANTATISESGAYIALFDEPYEVPDEYLGQKLIVSAYDLGVHKSICAGVNVPTARDWLPNLVGPDDTPAMPLVNGNRFVWLCTNLYTSTAIDGKPTVLGDTDIYMVEPYFG